MFLTLHSFSTHSSPPQPTFLSGLSIDQVDFACRSLGLRVFDRRVHFQNKPELCRNPRINVPGFTIQIAPIQESRRSVRMLVKHLSEGRSQGCGDGRVTISSCFLRNSTARWSWACALKSERQKDKSDLIIEAFVLLMGSKLSGGFNGDSLFCARTGS